MGEFECIAESDKSLLFAMTLACRLKSVKYQKLRWMRARDSNRQKYQFSVCILFWNFCESFSTVCAHLWLFFFIVSCWKFSAVYFSFFLGLALGVNDTLTEKYWNDETSSESERESEKENKEREMKFYDANEN